MLTSFCICRTRFCLSSVNVWIHFSTDSFVLIVRWEWCDVTNGDCKNPNSSLLLRESSATLRNKFKNISSFHSNKHDWRHCILYCYALRLVRQWTVEKNEVTFAMYWMRRMCWHTHIFIHTAWHLLVTCAHGRQQHNQAYNLVNKRVFTATSSRNHENC